MSPIQLGRSILSVGLDAGFLSSLASRFAADRRLLLPGFLAPELLHLIQNKLELAEFRPRTATRVFPPALDLKLFDPALTGALHFLLNDPAVVQFVRDVTGEPATGFVGAVYRMDPGARHRDSWHNDVDGNRRVGLTVNLSRHPFEGGELQLRAAGQAETLWTFANIGLGDALLFPIDEALEHCIRPVSGALPKTALAGWFCLDANRKD